MPAIYERLHGKMPDNSHYAESDTMTLMRCVIAVNKDFIRLAEENAKLFSTVQPI